MEADHNRPESRGAELVFGLVCAVGTNYHRVKDVLADALKQFDYEPIVLRLSDYLAMLAEVSAADDFERVSQLMDAGNGVRERTGRDDIVALAALSKLNASRSAGGCTCSRSPLPRKAHILVTLKNPKEVTALRRIYGPGFFLIGVHGPVEKRLQYLMGVRNISRENAESLIKRDEEEEDSFGQKTRKTFELADVFVDEDNVEPELRRFLDLVFGNPYITPSLDEHAMFLAAGAGMRSGQLGRQVGATILSKAGDVLATGCNDVPKAGGGLYWPGEGDARDHVIGYDSNERSRGELVEEIKSKLQLSSLPQDTNAKDWISLLRTTGLWDITEYGRAVHAEMDALLTCARVGTSPVGATLYTTTFPCHNCTRHIIAAGISRVVYIEPYPKSRALQLHFDSIRVDGGGMPDGSTGKVPFEPFIGVGPRRYMQLFSMHLGEGEPLNRKKDGVVIEWRRETAEPRVTMAPRSYLQQEQNAVKLFEDATREKEPEQT